MATTYATKANIDDEWRDVNVKSWMSVAESATLDSDDLAYIDRAINYAERRIDAILGSVVTTPFTGDDLTAMADLLREWTVDLAAIRIFTKTGMHDSQVGGALEFRYKRVIEDLEAFRAGEMAFPAGVSVNTQADHGHHGTEDTGSDDYKDKAFNEDTLT